MCTLQSGVRSAKTAQPMEWQFCDTEAEWQARQQESLATTISQPESTLRSAWVARQWRITTVLLIVLASIAGWTWRIAESGIAQLETDLRASIEADLWREAMRDDAESPNHATAAQDGTARPLAGTVQSWTLVGETAIVQLVTPPTADQPALRQTRFYRQTADGWLHTKPDAQVWGDPHHLASTHFIFHFRQHDRQVVAAVAPHIDDIYSELQHHLGLSSSSEKLVIEVSVEEPTGVMPLSRSVRGHLLVPSPAVYLAPVELSEQEILVQSLALPLIDDEVKRAVAVHRIPQHWLPLLRGLRLWQLWELDVPLASWQPGVLEWFYADLPKATADQRAVLPAGYSELCAMHRLWLLSPAVVGIPFECATFDTAAWTVKQWGAHVPPMSLAQLRMPLADWQTQVLDFPYFPDDTLALVTLIEYAVSVYGDEQLPVLLASLSRHNDWETLVPAVFGVSAADFEAGWRTYLAHQYHVSLEPQYESSRVFSR